MARNRSRLPWSRGNAAAGRDASFFEEEAAPRPNRDGRANFFSPVEEAQSHARWNRALLREKFRGPVSGTEQLAFGISAAAVAALADFEEEPRREGPFDPGQHDVAVNAPGAWPAKDGKAAALGQGEKATAKGGQPMHPFLEANGDDPFANPVANRGDGGGGAGARRMAARGSGAPLEVRVPGAERADAAAVRKAESGPGEARAATAAPSAPEAAPIIRGPAEANAFGVAAAVLSEASEEAREAVEAPARGGANTTKAEAARVPADAAARLKAKDAPPAAEAEDKADERPIAFEEACGEQPAAEDVPASVAEAKAEAGRSAAEAPGGRTRPKDAAVEKIERGDERPAPEEPVQAKAKDVSSVAGAEPGVDTKAAKTIATAKDAESVKIETAARPAEAVAQPKKDVPLLVEAKLDAGRDQAEAPEQIQTKTVVAATGLADAVQAVGAGATAGRAKAGDIIVAVDKVDHVKALADGTQAQAKAAEAAANATAKAAAPNAGLADMAAAQAKAAEAAASANKAGAAQGTGLTDVSAGHAKAAEIAANAAKAAAQNPAAADTPAAPSKAADLAANGAKNAAQGAGAADALAAKAADAVANGTKAGVPSAGPAADAPAASVKGAEAASAGAKAAASDSSPVDAIAVTAAKGAEAAVTGAKTKAEPGSEAIQAPSPLAKAKDVAGGTDAKSDGAPEQALAPGLVQAASLVVEANTVPAQILGDPAGLAKAKDAVAVDAKAADPILALKDAIASTKDVAGTKVDATPQPAKATDAPAAVVKADGVNAPAVPPVDAKAKAVPVVSEAAGDPGTVAAPVKTVPAVAGVDVVESQPPSLAPLPAKEDVQAVVGAKTDPNPRPADATVQKVTTDIKAEQADQSPAATGRTPAKDVPPTAVDHKAEPIVVAGETAADNKGVAATGQGGTLAVSPADAAIVLQGPDVKTADTGNADGSHTVALPAEPVPLPVPQAAPAVAAPVAGVVVPTETTMVFRFDVDEKGGPAVPVHVAPVVPPLVVGEPKADQTPPPGLAPVDAADGVLLGQPGLLGSGAVEALAWNEALVPFDRLPADGHPGTRFGHAPDIGALDPPSHLHPSDVVLI